MLVMLLLGFSSGIPYALTAGTLQAWLATEHVDIKTIGLFALVGIPYNWKFIWAPFMDRYFPPILGRRRGWMLVTQLLLACAIAGMALTSPVQGLTSMAVLAVFVAFFSSSQDIVIDAYRTEALPVAEYGAGAGVYTMGYRLAMLVSGAAALILADHYPWKVVYLFMALTVGVGIIGTFLGPEPMIERAPRTLSEAVWAPLKEFFGRRGVFEVVLFILFYKLDVVIATALMTKFFLDMGFTKTDIGAVTKVFGLIATIVGALLGGALIPRLGIRRALMLFGILQGVSTLLFYMMARVGNNRLALIFTIGGENLASGMATAAYMAFIMSLCNQRFTATQYALLTSLMAVPVKILSAPTGYLQQAVGWENYYLIAAALSLPGLLMLLRFNHWKAGLTFDGPSDGISP
ncbi:MAG: AmpG family muropeptide MFS transporter [Cryobacterium sp.]|nr:AmpG family muropeptide MFS transporter [Oligoflexia bacterium]